MSNLLSVKLRRDLRASWSRFVLAVIAIAISLTVFGGVLLAWGASGRETRYAYASTEPASATILLDQPISVDRMAQVVAEARKQPNVVQATGRTQFESSVTVDGQPRFIQLQVFAATPDDSLRMAKFFTKQRTWPAGPDQIYIAADSLGLLNLKVGDTLTLKTPAGESRDLEVADTVYDPSLSPSPQEQIGRGYVATSAIASSTAPLLDQVKIQVAAPGEKTPTRDRDTAVAQAAAVGQWLERRQGLAVREIQVPEPYRHPHQWQADSLLLSLLAGGAAALLLSTILVGNMLNNLFMQQIPQIGIMKAIGAGSGRIGRFYLTMTLTIAAAATLLGIGPAIWIGREGVARFLNFLGIAPLSLNASWWNYAVVIAIGLALPPLMALVPLLKASRITVRAAIDHHGMGAKPSAATGVLARLGRLTRLDRGLLMALRNTMRRPARFFLAMTLLASAGMVFVAGMSLTDGTAAIDEEARAQRTWDVDVALTNPVAMSKVTSALRDLPVIDSVEGMNLAKTGIADQGKIAVTRTYPDQGHGRISLITVPDKSKTFVVPKLLEGRWLRPGETGAIVLNQVSRKNTVPGVKAGGTVQLSVGGKPTTWKVVGVAQERTASGSVYTTPQGLSAALGVPQLVNQLRVSLKAHDEGTRQGVAGAINQNLTASGVAVKSSASISRAEQISAGHLGPIVSIILAIAVAMGVVGAIGLASTMSSNVLDRTREFGVMHAIGGRPRAVRRTVMAEGIFMGLLSCLVAALPAIGLTALLGTGLGNLFFSAPLPYRISAVAVVIWVLLATLGSVLATQTAARRASRITVREALAYI